MECWALFTAIGKEGKDLGDLNEAAGPLTLSAGAVAGLMRVMYSHGRRAEGSRPLRCSCGTQNVYPKIRTRQPVWQS